MPTAEEVVKEHDKDKRIKAERAILAVAKEITNGESTNPKKVGQVLYWLVGNSLDNNELLRTVVDDQDNLRSVVDCEAAMAKCPGRVVPDPGRQGLFKLSLGHKSLVCGSGVVITGMICATLLLITGHWPF